MILTIPKYTLPALICMMLALTGCEPGEPSAGIDRNEMRVDSAEDVIEPAVAVSVVEIPVTGMTCEHCEKAIRTKLLSVPGIVSASPSHAEKRAVVRYDPDQVTVVQVVETINDIGGYEATLPTAEATKAKE